MVGLAVLTGVFRSLGAEVELSTAQLPYLALTVVVAAVGDRRGGEPQHDVTDHRACQASPTVPGGYLHDVRDQPR
ncbi:MAG TPA: hypothetical protein VFZ70_01425 [Euzebyales bacterium]